MALFFQSIYVFLFPHFTHSFLLYVFNSVVCNSFSFFSSSIFNPQQSLHRSCIGEFGDQLYTYISSAYFLHLSQRNLFVSIFNEYSSFSFFSSSIWSVKTEHTMY